MTSDSRLSFEVSSILSKNEGLSFVSMAVEEETETRSDLRHFAESLKKGFVSDKGFARIIYFIIDPKKSKAGFIGFWVGNLFAPFAPWRERVFCREGRPRKSAFTYAKSERFIGADDEISKFVFASSEAHEPNMVQGEALLEGGACSSSVALARAESRSSSAALLERSDQPFLA